MVEISQFISNMGGPCIIVVVDYTAHALQRFRTVDELLVNMCVYERELKREILHRSS